MTIENKFELANRNALRFNSPKGLLTVEDLWNLPLTSTTSKANLDDIAVGLHNELKTEAVSFVTKADVSDAQTQLAFEIVVHIINVRVAENQAATTLRLNREKKQQIMAIIEQKQNEQLAGASIDDLRAMLDAL
jgi:hypothetical protein